MDLSDVELRRLSDNLGSEWHKLATFLGFTRAKIQQFELNHADGDGQCVENTIFDMLVSWKERQPTRTNFRKLLKVALDKCGRVDLADSISPESARDKLDEVYSILKNKLETDAEQFEDAIIAFHQGFISKSSDLQLALALRDFGKAFAAEVLGKPDVTKPQTVRKWNKKKSITDSNFDFVCEVAIHQDGNIAVVDSSHQRPIQFPMVFGANGNGEPTYTNAFVLGLGDLPIDHLSHLEGIAVTHDGKYLLADWSTKVKVFDDKGVYLREFSSFANPEGNIRQAVGSKCITVARDSGNVLVGDCARELVTVHDGIEFNLTSEVYIDMKPDHIVANEQQLWVSSWEHGEDGKVVAFNYSGDELYAINPVLSGTPARPNGMVCTSRGYVFVSVSKVYGPRSEDLWEMEQGREGYTKPGSGHVHEYSASEGKFIRCLIKGLHWPLGMAIDNDMIVIANTDYVNVYTPF